MYVIGRAECGFINITYYETTYDGKKYLDKIGALEYEAPLHKATIIPDILKAEKMLKEIQTNVENIVFINDNIVGDIFDRENNFDKVAYSRELKLYRLSPVEVT